MPNSLIRDKLARGEFFAAPGIQDMITAVIAKQIGFEVVYASGFWMTASAYGLPDAGIATYTQMVDRVRTLAQTVGSAAVIADADTGYGGLLNVHHTVRGYEQAGASAVQLEDQEFPKKCGHTPYKRVIPADDMVEKIRVALEARLYPETTLIIARTDALASEGFEATLRRCEAYAQAGADIIFLEAPQTEEQMRTACKRIRKPMMANMSDGGLTPIRSARELEALGYRCAIYPAGASLAAAEAARRALQMLRDEGRMSGGDVKLYDFKQFCSQIGFEEVWDFERRWAPGSKKE
jgi:2-methylisocitrate lyase-like PEP mutase family enzyme